MEAKDIVAEYFERVLNRLDTKAANLDETDCMVYLIVSVLRTIRSNDFEAIFEVLLDDEDLMIFIDFLEVLDESDMADDFRQAQCILDDGGYAMTCEGEAIPGDLQETLEPIKASILSNPGLELLEPKLVETIGGF